MRWMLLLTLLLLAACGGNEAEAPEVSITDATWSSDEIAIDADTNLPDGAILSWSVLDGDDWDDLDAADTSGFATVEDGTATATADVANFTEDEALASIAFVANYDEQPEGIGEAYGPPFSDHDWPADWKERASDEQVVSR